VLTKRNPRFDPQELWVLGSVGDYIAEFMAGGIAVICGYNPQDPENVLGYNASGDFVVGALEGADLNTPALNQQEGTVVSIDNQVLPLNVALSFEGHTLNDLAKSVGIVKEHTIEYTSELNPSAGFKRVAFDDLENFLDNYGNDKRGYILDEVVCEAACILSFG